MAHWWHQSSAPHLSIIATSFGRVGPANFHHGHRRQSFGYAIPYGQPDAQLINFFDRTHQPPQLFFIPCN